MRMLVLLLGDTNRQQRIGKEVQTLIRVGHHVTILELPRQDQKVYFTDYPYKVLSIQLWTRRLPKNLLFWPLKYLEMTLRFFIAGIGLKPDIVHCVDRMPLLSAFMIARKLNIPYIYDSQEIHAGIKSSANKPRWLWLLLEQSLARRAIRVLVTDHFRLGLTANILGLDISKMYALMNLPKLPSVSDGRSTSRADCPWQNGKLAVYAGAINPNRHIEEIIEALTYLPPEYRFALVGFVEDNYKISLQLLAKKLCVDSRTTILPPVRWSDLPYYIASADCALVFYKKNSLNNYYCSPSKLFDALIAGIPVICGDNPLMVEVIQENDAGLCIKEVDPKSIAKAVRKVLERKDLQAMKSRIAAFARANYCWDIQEKDFIRFYSEVETEVKTLKHRDEKKR